MQLDENHTPELHRDCWMRDCSDELAHALEVTAPWEWKGPKGKVCYLPSGGRADVAAALDKITPFSREAEQRAMSRHRQRERDG